MDVPDRPFGELRIRRAVVAPRIKPQAIPMSTGRTPDVFHGQFCPDTRGALDLPGRRLGRPDRDLAPRRHRQARRGQSETELSNDLLVGARLLERAATGMPRKLRDPLIEAAEALRKPGDPFTRAARRCPTRSSDCWTSIRCAT